MSISRLQRLIDEKRAPICAGLDIRDSMPERDETQYGFGKRILATIADLIPCVKLQSAFYESKGLAGMNDLALTLDYARSKGLYAILDAKRGDIASTAEAYAKAYLTPGSEFEADALTVNAYLGADSIKPFIAAAKAFDKSIFVLVKTSNPGSVDIQDLLTERGEPVYAQVAGMLDELNEPDYLGFVIGATFPLQLTELRARYPNTFFLVPGYGAQGASADDIAVGFNSSGGGLIVNSSRNILLASDPRAAVYEMINEFRRVLHG